MVANLLSVLSNQVDRLQDAFNSLSDVFIDEIGQFVAPSACPWTQLSKQSLMQHDMNVR